MKHTFAGICLLVIAGAADAALTFAPAYGGYAIHTHASGDAVIGFDWAADGELYYATSTASFTSGGFFRKDGGGSVELVAGNGSLFSGSSVVAIGGAVYFNDSNFGSQFIRVYDTVSSTLTTVAAVNYAMASDGVNLFTSGSSDFVETRIVRYAGGVLGAGLDIGGVAGASGPLAFDGVGNLFYAPGFGDTRIYRWTAAEVAVAVAGGQMLMAAGSVFSDYSTGFPTMAGGTSMAVDAGGNVFITLTNFADPSLLVRFDEEGVTSEVVASSTELLGGLNYEDGRLFVASGNGIFAVVPEPSCVLLVGFAVGMGVLRRRR